MLSKTNPRSLIIACACAILLALVLWRQTLTQWRGNEAYSVGTAPKDLEKHVNAPAGLAPAESRSQAGN